MYLINFEMDNIDNIKPTAEINLPTKESLLLPIFAYLGGRLNQSSKHWTERQEDYNMYYLQFTIEGSGILKYEDNTFELNKGDIILINSLNYHFYKTGNLGYWKYCYLNLYGDTCKTFYNLLYNDYFKIYNIEDINECIKMFDTIYSKMSKTSLKGNIEISHLLTEFFHNLSLQIIKDEDSIINNWDMDFIINYIQSSFKNNITILNLSKIFGYSEEYFIRKFKKNIGITPYQYITLLKINFAKNMLINTDKSINLIADLSGFKNVQNMINCFNKYEKTSPLKYKKIILDRFICKR